MLLDDSPTPDQFLARVEAFLASRADPLDVPVATLLTTIPNKQLLPFLDRKITDRPSLLDAAAAIAGALTGGTSGLLIAGGGMVARRQAYGWNRRTLMRLLSQFTIHRSRATLSQREIALLRGMATLTANSTLTPDAWHEFLARLAFDNSPSTKGVLIADDDIANHARTAEVREILTDILRSTQPGHDAMLGEAAQMIAQSNMPTATAALSDGARFLQFADLSTSTTYSTTPTPASLILGTLGANHTPIYFNSHQSLITIGGAGTGKSQAHVITNLLRYSGSAFVLDPSGELWQATAGHRQKTFGPVYRFAPLDPSGRTHRFNPFDFIATEPHQAAIDCEVFSHQMIAENPRANDKFWDNSSRDLLWAFATALAITAPPRQRRLDNLAQLVNLPYPPVNPHDPAFTTTESGQLLDLFDLLATSHNIPELHQAADRIRSGMAAGGKTLDSILVHARTALAQFGRSITVRNAMAASDWHPAILRKRPGSTIYLCIPPSDLRAFAPIVRLMFQTHLRVLEGYRAKPDEPPITFFMDEMPQLGTFESLLVMQDTGRKAGLRLWMFAQYLGQIKDAYGQSRGQGLVEQCAVRMFMAPDDDAYRIIQPVLGEETNTFTGEKRPLATAADLRGRKWGHAILALADREHPAMLDKVLAFKSFKNLMIVPPIVQKVASST